MSPTHRQAHRATETPSATAVTVTSRPMWRLRLTRELPRHLLHALATLGLLASARYAIDPPAPTLPMKLVRRPAPATGQARHPPDAPLKGRREERRSR